MNSTIVDHTCQDGKLLIALRAGDNNAFKQIIKRFSGSVYFLILKQVYFKDIARVLTNEVFEKVFVSFWQYEPKFSFSTWLFRIAHNHAIDHLRNERVRGGSSIGSFNYLEYEVQDKAWSAIDNPEDLMIKDEVSIILHKFVSDLPPRYRVLLELRYFEEYSYAEIASELKIPVGTIKVRLFRSRKLLYEMLKKSEINHC